MSTARITIACGTINAKLIDAPKEAQQIVSKVLSYLVDGAETQTAFQTGHWDGRSSFFEMRHARFPAGFVHMVVQALSKRGYQVQVRKKPLPEALGPARPMIDDHGYTDPNYDYQPEVADKIVRHGRFIAQIATGGGKSRVAQIVTARVGRPTLFLTTRSVLMYQMRGHYEKMLISLAKHHPELSKYSKYSVGVMGDSIWEPRKFVNVGMVQTIAARLKEPDPFSTKIEQAKQKAIRDRTLKIMEMFEVVILEEAHEASGQSYYDIMRACKNAMYRLALTATPFMKDSQEANMRLMAASGPIGIRVSEKQLIDAGILAKPYFRFVETSKPAGLFRTTGWPRCYRVGIAENPERNKRIILEATHATSYGLPVLILVQRKEHGKLLERALTENGIRTAFIFGESKNDQRQLALDRLAKGVYQILIGSTILDVGVDVPAIGMIILAGGGKAEVQLRQRIGRGLRAKRKGPNIAFVVDFQDLGNTYLTTHAITRRTFIEQTPGFAENILPNDTDFDFKGLGFDI